MLWLLRIQGGVC